MFACGDCPRRGGKVAAAPCAEFEGAEIAAAAYAGEACSAFGKKTQCLHPDKPAMFACGDCPRRGGKTLEAESAEIAVAAFLGEAPSVHGKKTQCLPPDKPAMFACGDCPRRGGKVAAAPCAEFEGAEIAAAAYAGEACSAFGKKTQCLHPDKPAMFACGDCPRRGGKTLEAESAEIAVAAFLGEAPSVHGKKTQCLHPDKPAMFACADCPRRGGKVPEASEVHFAAAALVGEATCAHGKKTQCLHPDKPAMFACGDCPRRGGKAPELQGTELAAAAFVSEATCPVGKKTQCLHPDKPAMFACGDCPRRGGKAPAVPCADFDGTEIAVAAFVGEESAVFGKKTQCLHPDKPAMFACGDCPRRGGKAPKLENTVQEAETVAAAYIGESVPSCACSSAAKKSQCLHPDKPAMFACGDCPRRG
mmetsp:Transcript_80671/g.182033  ORF Transcript_80671/g.182033 Transcript_80671/m.182033 type:complete len:420 (-) Transcript_80671:55-1314(-)